MKKYTIGLDLGTSAVKGVLYDGESVIDTCGADFSYKASSLDDGSKYIGFDADDFYLKIAGVIKELTKSAPESVSGIAIASASGNTLLVDENGKTLIDAYSWTNSAFTEESDEFLSQFSREYVYNVCGWPFSKIFPLAHLAHIKKHSPNLLKRAKTICMTTEYVLYKLTNKWGIDTSTATPFFLVEQQTGKYHKPFLDALEIELNQLPPIFNSGDLLGTTIKQVEEATGLKEGTKVYLGSFDHPSGARANGINKEGDLLLSCGTSWVGFFPYHDREAIINNKLLCDPFLNKQGLWGAMFSVAQVSKKIEKIIDKFISNDINKYDLFNAYSKNSVKDANGLKIDLLNDLEKDFSMYSKEDISRALMESVGYLLKNKIDILKANGISFNRVVMAGGPTKSKIWISILEYVLGLPIEVKYGVNSGAVGAAKFGQIQ